MMAALALLKQKLASLTRLVVSTDYALDRRDYVKQWLLRSDTQFYVALHRSLLVILSIVEVAIYFLGREYGRMPLLVANGICIVLVLIAKFVLEKLNRSITPIVGLIQLVALTGYGVALRNAAMADPTISGLTPMTILYPTAMAMALILSPFSTFVSALLACYLVAIPLTVHATAGIMHGFTLLVNLAVIGGCAVFALVINNIRMSRSRRQAQLELSRRSLLAQNERLKRDAIEKDMLLASKIQESLSLPRSLSLEQGFSGSFHQRKVGMLGGDWIGAKRHDDGNLYIAVVDVTGKGVAAALVVHAVQALWAAEISQPSFHPEEWIRSVNRTLIALGRNAPQTLSLGLVAAGSGTLKYYSAGHVPLYVVFEVDGKRSLKTLTSRGSILGISEPIQLVADELDLRSKGIRWVLGGTDGVFTKKTRSSRRQSLELIERLANGGAEGLLDTTLLDDKILFVLENAA